MSSPSTTAPPEVKPSVVHLSDILSWVRQGRLRPTRFQRPFRWDRTRVCDLFDSIRKQYPVGTLLIWVSTRQRPTRNTLGPLKLPPPAGSSLLLIDGQQRVSTIAGVLLRQKLEDAESIEDPGMWDLWFDAKDLSFCHLDREPPPSTCIRVRDLLDIRAIMKATGALSSTLKRDEDIQEVADAWQAAATALTAYRIPVVEFHTDDLTLAVESFTRLNRRGLDISADEMFSALAEDESKEKRLADYIDETLRAVKESSFGELDRLTVLRLILLELELDPFRTDWNRLNADQKGAARTQMEEVAQRSQQALLRGLRFMRDDLTLVSTRLLPYSGILVGLATYLGAEERSLSIEERDRLVAWIWHAAFAGFAEGNPSRATQAWRALRAAGRQQGHNDPLPRVAPNARATPFPLRHDLRSARLQTSLWAAMTTWGFDAEKMAQIGRFINSSGADAWCRIFRPRRVDLSLRHKELLSSPANRVFDEWGLEEFSLSSDSAAKLLLTCDPARSDDEARLKRMQISQDAWRALQDKSEERFLEIRLQTMIDDERALMARLGVAPPEDASPRPAPIDHEGDIDAEDDI